jgi:cytochrome c oxidase subunit 2
MWPASIPFWRSADSSYAGDVDLLFLGLLAASLLVLALLFTLMLVFVVRYRKGSNADRGDRIKKSWHWEVSWTTATFVAFLGLFVWGASLYMRVYTSPSDALPIYVVAKQWMWKVQHPGGQREINELHVPSGRTVRLTMASQDVIHSFFVPAFRVKHDVVPGRYQSLWFKPEKPGVFPLLCAEYCGTDHSAMTGRVVVMKPADYSAWLQRQDVDGTLASQGAALFRSLGCSGCHGNGGTVRAPPLEGVYGRPVPLSDGTTVIADERYIRDSILRPRSQIVASYEPLMPSFEGRVSEDDLIKIVAYIKSLGPGDPSMSQQQ